MDFPPSCEVPRGTDPRLHPFLEATSPNGVDAELTRLLELATPLVLRVVRNRPCGGAEYDADDVVSEVRTQVVACLQRLRAEGGASSLVAAPIADFENYVRTVAYNIWAETLRQQNPERTKLQNRLHYLLAKRSTQHGFALWRVDGSGTWAGFECWRDTVPTTFSGERHLRLMLDPHSAADEACGAGEWSPLNLPDLVAGLLGWLGGPLKLSELVNAVARLQGSPVSAPTLASEDADHPLTESGLVDPRPSPCDELRWKEYLTWLWQQSAQLTLPQRCAFLLHSPCLHEMEFAGLTSIRLVASALGLATECMAELWNSLPLDDLAIGRLLGAERQQVINWRKAARIRLGHEWQRWSEQG